MTKLRMLAGVSLAALTLVACGTRADFSGVQPVAQRTEIVEELVDASGGVVAAPSAGSSTTVTTRTSTTLRQGSGIRDGVIRIGGLFPMSGGLSALGRPPAKAARAYFQHVNDTGGINGLKIDFRICDDEADPNLSAACTERLVNDGIFVMGPSFTPFSNNVPGILAERGVPWVGYDGINLEGFDSDIVVTVGAPIQTMAHALLPYWYEKTEASLGHPPTKLGIVYLNSPPAITYRNEAKDVICPRLGCEITVEQSVTYATLAEYSSICLRMRDAAVDSVWIVTDPASAVKMLVQCRELKYKPPGGFLGQHGIYMDLTVDNVGEHASGILANSALLPPSVDAPANREMKRIVGTYEADMSYGYFTALGYASARMTVDIISEALRVDPTLSRASMMKAAARLTSYDCHGLCRDVDLSPPAAVSGGNHFVWMVRSRYSEGGGDRWVLDGGPVDAWRASTWPRPGRP